MNLINDDDLGLLAIKSDKSANISTNERLVASFLEINNFVQENSREPELGRELKEHQLAARLQSIRRDRSKIKLLLDYDEFNLLDIDVKEINSIKDVFEDDDLGILESVDDNLFRISHVQKGRNSPEYVARRKPCKNFSKYESLFKECQGDLAAGRRKLIKFTSEKQVIKNNFFVLNGILLYIEEIGKTHIDKFGKINGRQRCIFENGTESNMLFRSLVQRLYENGHAVSENIENTQKDFLKNFNVISENDNKTGYIYIVKSLSKNPKIKSLENLYKIGYSTDPIEERIKKAEEDPTFLMAPVKIISTYECYNFNPRKLEQLLHNFFGSACLNIDIFDSNNKRYIPREWFIAPLNIIEKVIELIIDGGIVNFKYDIESQSIVYR